MEKGQPFMAVPEAAPAPNGSSRFISRLVRLLLVGLFTSSVLYMFLRLGPNCFHTPNALYGNEAVGHNQPLGYLQQTIIEDGHEEPSSRIPLEAHVMSKCPDAQYCLQHLVVPAMEKIHEKVDFRLSFIGRSIPRSLVASAG